MLNPRSSLYRYDRLGQAAAPASRTPDRGHTPPILVIGIDAVPYQSVRRLMEDEADLLPGFKGPAAVNSTFPSISYTAWSNLMKPLGSDKPLGYETRYFDGVKRKLTGGFSLSEAPPSWKKTFDWKLDGLARTALAYGLPRRYSLLELRRGLQAFARSQAPVFSMYIVSTDGLAHLRGPDALSEVMRVVATELAAFKRRHPDKPFRTVLLSDHGIAGGQPLINLWPAVRHAVGSAGFSLRKRLGTNDRNVVFNPYGLLTGFVVYTHEGRKTDVAEAVTTVPGVDFAAVCGGPDRWRLYSSRGTALIERRRFSGRVLWRYQPLTGDPLGYRTIVAALHRRSGAGDWFPDAWWFEATRNAFYPDALHRLAQSFELAATPASMVCSCTPGYMFGGLKTEYLSRATIGRLKWSHGALDREASLGFMTSDLPEWEAPGMVRAEDALTVAAAQATATEVSGRG